MTKKKLFNIFIFLFFIVTFLIGLLKIVFVQLDYYQFTVFLESLYYGYNFNNIALGVFSHSLTVLLIAPIFEEFIFRSWLTKKITFIKSITFLMFVFNALTITFLNKEFIYSIIDMLTQNSFWYLNFFIGIYPPITFVIFNNFALVTSIFFPFFIFIALLLNLICTRVLNKSFPKLLDQFSNYTSPILLITLSSLVFYFVHNKQLLFKFDTISDLIMSYNSITLFIGGFIFSYVAYYYSLRMSILLHILFNLTSGIYLLKNISTTDNVIQYLIYILIFVILLYSIYIEIQKLKRGSRNLELAKV